MKLTNAALLLIATLLSGCAQTAFEGSVALGGTDQPSQRSVRISESAPDRIRAELIDLGRSGVFFESIARDGAVTWRAGDQSALVTEDGLLKSTFGLGFDLVSADVSDLRALILGGRTGNGVRVHRYLDGENQIIPRAFRCEVTRADEPTGRTRMIEQCFGADLSFENDYVLGRDGGIVSSRQWVGPEIGRIRITRLEASLDGTVVVVAGN